MNRISPNREHFQVLLNRILDRVNKLKSNNMELVRENTRLKTEIDKLKQDETDAFSHTSESERMMIKNQIDGLIDKIDQYIED